MEEFSTPELVSFQAFSSVCYPARGRIGHWNLLLFLGERQLSNFVAKSGSTLLHFLPLKCVLAEIIYRNGSYIGRVSNNLLIKFLVGLLSKFLKDIVNVACVFKRFIYFFRLSQWNISVTKMPVDVLVLSTT